MEALAVNFREYNYLEKQKAMKAKNVERGKKYSGKVRLTRYHSQAGRVP